MDSATLASIVGSAAFVAALLQFVKWLAPDIPTRWLPLVSMALSDACGMGAAAILGNLTWLVVGTVLVGGFMASGFYAGAKALVNPSPAPLAESGGTAAQP